MTSQCNGICRTAYEIGIAQPGIAIAHPDCEKHGQTPTGGDAQGWVHQRPPVADGAGQVNVDWDADDVPLRYRARDGRIDSTHSENGSVLASVPLPTRQQARLNLARLIAGEGWTVVPSEAAYSAAAMQEDLARILDALGLDVISRPYSPHECVTRDVLPAIERLRAESGSEETTDG